MSAGLSKNKLEIRDVKDRTAEQDPEYQKVVKEIVDQNARYSRISAFDRQDLLYLSDFRDAEAQKEQEMRYVEASEFAQLRSRLESNSTEAPASASSGGLPGPAVPTTLRVAVKEKQQLKPAAKLIPAVVKVQKDKEPADGPGTGPLPKRARTDSIELAADAAGCAATPGANAQGGSNGVGGQADQSSDGDEPSGGLQGLLGGYGSDDNSDDAGKAKQQQPGVKRQGTGTGRMVLPNAASLFEDDEAGPGGNIKTKQTTQAQGNAPTSSSDSDSD